MNNPKENEAIAVDARLDITGETCPLTFVRTKLLLEKMRPGAIVEVRLKGAEPLENVPKAVRDHGHEVLSLTPESDSGGETGIHRLLVRRN
jgi:TusA-related sulfurtransferase